MFVESIQNLARDLKKRIKKPTKHGWTEDQTEQGVAIAQLNAQGFEPEWDEVEITRITRQHRQRKQIIQTTRNSYTRNLA